MTDRETAVVVGAGPGLGAALARCFANAGMNVAVAAREPARLSGLMDTLARGGTHAAFGCDATVADDVARLFEKVGDRMGVPRLVVFNAGAFVRGSILEIPPDEFERCWRVGCLGGFLVGQAAARAMLATPPVISAGDGSGGGVSGSILFTGATASLRGGALFANLAVGKFGLRALAQSMARELGSRGIHIGHVIVDGIIASERSGGQTAEESRLDPDALAANYLMLHRQPKSAWTLELDLRPWVETF